MNELNFQKIVDILQTVFPNKWVKVIFYAEYTSGSFSMKYYADLGNGTYVDCYSATDKSKAQFIKTFMAIDKEIAPVRKTLDEKQKWSVMTIKIEANGEFKAFFDYTNIEGNILQFHDEWEKKYLV